MKIMKLLALAAAAILLFCGCGADLDDDYGFGYIPEETVSQLPETAPADSAPDETAPPESTQPETTTSPETTQPETTTSPETDLPDRLPEEGEYYYDVENVVLYLELYGELPPNFITKDEARKLGWEGGSVEDYLEGAAIGGDYFGNYEGMLPEKKGRTYRECDIDTDGYYNRGSRRLIYSDDGLYFYSSDHYKTFKELKVTEDYEVTE